MSTSNKQILSFQNEIILWYQKNKRDLPWRKTTNPFYIHLSEIMLQQTQVERVKNYYKTFIEKYPTPKEMSNAKTSELLKDWQGLGFNSRILRFREASKLIEEKYGGFYPKTRKELLELPGVGPYTSSAILAFAFNKTVPVIDTNIRRVLLHFFKLKENTSLGELEEFAIRITPENNAREWNNALMDYASRELTAKKTGIKSLSKQSKFQGSTRQARSTIVKELLKNHQLILNEISELIPNHNVEKILKSLEKDSIISIDQNRIYLKDS